MRVLVIITFVASLFISCGQSTEKEQPENPKQPEPAYTGPIIDMHIHGFTDNPGFEAMLGKIMPPRPGMEGLSSHKAPETFEEVKKETFARFEKYHIVKAVTSPGMSWKKDAPDQIIAGSGINPSTEQLRLMHEQGMLEVLGEVAPNYQGILPTDDRLTPYFDLAVELGLPVGYHLFPGGPQGGAYGPYPMTRASQGRPLQFEEILLKRPEMKLYIMHAAWPYLEDLKALMYAHPQVYVEVGVICWNLPRKEFHHYLKGLIDAGFGKRIMYGTDQMIWPTTIDEGIAAVNSAEFLTLEQKADIFYNNAARFLNLSEEEIAAHKSTE